MIKCSVCKGNHRTKAVLDRCQNPNNPDYIALLVERHQQGYHGVGTGGHHNCPICNPNTNQNERGAS